MWEVIAVWLSGSSLALLVFTFALMVRTFNWVARVDRKLDALLKHSGVDPRQLASQEAKALLTAGNKIEAIRVYRLLTGAGLAEAKAVVEKLR